MGYKLTYFNVRGLGEPIRYLFKYGNIEFEDIRLSFNDFTEMKASTPFGQVPLLEYNGKIIPQNLAICRYLAKKVGLDGKNDWENLEIDAIMDTFTDMRLKSISIAFREINQEKKIELIKTVVANVLPEYLAKFDAIIAKNGGFLVGGKLTWADLYFATFGETFDTIVKVIGDSNFLKKYTNVVNLIHKVNEIPQIKAWIEVRPPVEV